MKRYFAPVFLAGMIHFAGGVYSQNLTVQITSPQNKASFEKCSQIHIIADVQILGGEIQEVVFYQNGTAIATVDTVPYETDWANVPNGWYALSAMAVDTAGNEAFSDTVLVNVGNTQEGNLCVNGEFSCALPPWRLDQYEDAKATIEIIPDLELGGEDAPGARIQIQDVGKQTWGVQLMQTFKLKQGHTYEVSFIAQAEEPKAIQVTFSKDYFDWGTHWYQDVTVEGLAEYGPYTFECGLDDPKVMFKFVVGGNLIGMDLDAVKIIDKNWTDVEAEPVAIRGYALEQNYPNPFNPETTIAYTLPKTGEVRVAIYDILGNAITSWSEHRSSGTHQIKWNGRDDRGLSVPSGIYLYKLETDGFSMSRKMLMVR
jgi:hypothetical protein